ncbi:hypothetical protein niasHT_008401 [Heterodera trifolii]|uniref:EF-hand domain-containing protein n=1 Tax=Heterodera trifolii TaxID=157864 RepID=A0ABD2LRK6_9BILA
MSSTSPKRPNFLNEKCRHPSCISNNEREAARQYFGMKRKATDDEPTRPRFLNEKCRHASVISLKEREDARRYFEKFFKCDKFLFKTSDTSDEMTLAWRHFSFRKRGRVGSSSVAFRFIPKYWRAASRSLLEMQLGYESKQIERIEMLPQSITEMIFDKVSKDGSSKIDKDGLQTILSNGTGRAFNPDTCRLLIALFDFNCDGVIDRNEFGPLWKYVEEWKASFKKIAGDNELSICVERLEIALREYGYRFSADVYCELLRKYDRTISARLHFDDFIHLCIVLQQLTTPFRDRDFGQKGRISHPSPLFPVAILSTQCTKMNRNNLKRFQIKPLSAEPKGSEEQPTSRTKTLSEVKEFDSAGTFFLRAKLVSVLFCIYKSCPMRSKGIPCRKKLDSEDFCVSCVHRAKKPSRNLYLRVVLQDCDDEECEQETTAFSYAAINFLSIASVEAFYNLSENTPNKLESILQSKIDQPVLVKVNIKENNDTAMLDWIISSISVEKPAAVKVLDDKNNDDEVEEEASSSDPPLKRTKNNQVERAIDEDADDIHTIE